PSAQSGPARRRDRRNVARGHERSQRSCGRSIFKPASPVPANLGDGRSSDGSTSYRCTSRSRCDIGRRSVGARGSDRRHRKKIIQPAAMILHIGRVILVIIEVLVIFNLLIVVHEVGHFLAARWRGLYIEKFGVWFGKPLWKKKINGVQYSLGSLPFGGFVALPQLAPMDIIEGKADVDREQLPPISALDKIIVAVAGPFFSLLLAFVFAAMVWLVGYPVSEADATTVIGHIMPNSPAVKAGLR